jgi:hypothetical protein
MIAVKWQNIKKLISSVCKLSYLIIFAVQIKINPPGHCKVVYLKKYTPHGVT